MVSQVNRNASSGDSLTTSTSAVMKQEVNGLVHLFLEESTRKVTQIYNEFCEINNKVKNLLSLSEVISKKIDLDGGLSISKHDDKLRACLQVANAEGIEISLDKESFTKDEVSKLTVAIDAAVEKYMSCLKTKKEEMKSIELQRQPIAKSTLHLQTYLFS